MSQLQTRYAFALPSGALIDTGVVSDRFSFNNRFVALDAQALGLPSLSLYSTVFLDHYDDWRNRQYELPGGIEYVRSSMALASKSAARATAKRPVKGPGARPIKRPIKRPRKTPGKAPQRSGGDVGGLLPSLFGDGDIGLMFLERTRVRPAGFALGEHLFSLSLAPGEEVTLEQRSYSERVETYEEASERDQQQDSEMTASLATELSSSMQRALNENRSESSSLGGTLGASYKGVSVSASASQQNSLNTADSNTRNESVKATRSVSEKLSAKFRTQHKTSFKVSQVSRFEASQKRVLRNPNAATPIDLVYFKVLQKLQLAQERYGVRYCWAPFVKSPGTVLQEAISAKDQQLRQLPVPGLRTVRPMPLPPNPAPPRLMPLGLTALTRWGVWGDMRHNYTFDIVAPQGYEWDFDADFVRGSLSVVTATWGARREPNVYVVAASSNGANGVRLIIHAGADGGGAGATLSVDVQARFRASPQAPDPAYLADLAKWHQERAEADTANAKARDDWEQALRVELAKWTAAYMKNFSPVAAAMQLLVKGIATTAQRDSGPEVELWNQLFDFENAGMLLYPSWWSDDTLRDPLAGPDAFINASWARLFLPIRAGREVQGLRWLLTGTLLPGPANSARERTIAELASNIAAYRTTNFGGATEVRVTPPTAPAPCPQITAPYLCLGTWEELLPTDGTHLEVLQAKSTATDDWGVAEESRRAAGQAASMLNAQKSAELKAAVASGTVAPPTLRLDLSDDPPR
ncbi:MAG: hypothetical protein ING41_13445 [Burkholderiales bacterium]|jgi:hypothetical protein|nr:hypothetical protein [Burkholderiales bacterium]